MCSGTRGCLATSLRGRTCFLPTLADLTSLCCHRKHCRSTLFGYRVTLDIGTCSNCSGCLCNLYGVTLNGRASTGSNFSITSCSVSFHDTTCRGLTRVFLVTYS